MKAAMSQPMIIQNARQASVVRGSGFMAAFGGADQGDAGKECWPDAPGSDKCRMLRRVAGFVKRGLEELTESS
jgi:hypothetical protein